MKPVTRISHFTHYILVTRHGRVGSIPKTWFLFACFFILAVVGIVVPMFAMQVGKALQ